jgi:hypothetical protein
MSPSIEVKRIEPMKRIGFKLFIFALYIVRLYMVSTFKPEVSAGESTPLAGHPDD